MYTWPKRSKSPSKINNLVFFKKNKQTNDVKIDLMTRHPPKVCYLLLQIPIEREWFDSGFSILKTYFFFNLFSY